MSQTRDQLIAGLKEASLTEQTGVQFYTFAADNTTYVRGREVFQQLARDEAEHQQWLRRQYGHVVEGTPWEEMQPVFHAELSGSSPIFSIQLFAIRVSTCAQVRRTKLLRHDGNDRYPTFPCPRAKTRLGS